MPPSEIWYFGLTLITWHYQSIYVHKVYLHLKVIFQESCKVDTVVIVYHAAKCGPSSPSSCNFCIFVQVNAFVRNFHHHCAHSFKYTPKF